MKHIRYQFADQSTSQNKAGGMKHKDYHQISGIKKGADNQTVKQAYHRLACQYHPDKPQGDKQAKEKFTKMGAGHQFSPKSGLANLTFGKLNVCEKRLPNRLIG